ncbi:hypothetical protein BDW02DRAFT_597710 [Decorospora gaudefroyi]|uniref:Uncharacterized protein n=1 Tax=Decorospora gaudefroyi TaxID=184978 RepID=A0A6A5KKQ6_9PLEO|nr:hypothetical protein BDW02DRAFT_597710 [Decorospora gaudefroyi]
MSVPENSCYNISASKGFSYRVPVAVQATLKRLLKKLPSPVRPIYKEYYGDLMASRACAQDSAKAMAGFVEKSFPKISTDHNRLARLMNAEIDRDEHSYVPFKFPTVGDGTAADSDEEVMAAIQVPKTNRRQAVDAISEKLSHPKAKRAKMGKKARAPETAVLASPTAETDAPVHGLLSPVEEAPVDDSTVTALKVVNGAEDHDHKPDAWTDSLWSHGDWIDGMEVIDTLPRA